MTSGKKRYVERYCQFCGQVFWATVPHATNCSRTCQQKSWRARSKLAGTHAWDANGNWKRLPQPAA